MAKNLKKAKSVKEPPVNVEPIKKPIEEPTEKRLPRKANEVLFHDQTYFVNFNELIKVFDMMARGSHRQPMYNGARGAHYALGQILGIDIEEARQLILKYAGQT